MTGREAKILSGYGSFATQHANPEEDSSGIVLLVLLTCVDFSFYFRDRKRVLMNLGDQSFLIKTQQKPLENVGSVIYVAFVSCILETVINSL